MRPIRLEIEGLQSFEEKQIIDFKTLTEHGLFGIFGETGSGKSTILDAITLAIYGDIVRLGNSKDDKLISLLNVNSDKIEVTYVFSLGDVEYTINRKFPKKKKELEFGSKKVLMYCGDEIIADKDREIKSRVEELIGLSMEDFTRSVVLPQGKFSEFLKLTGKDKRNMLERIFNLEKYGNKLTIKLNFEKSKKKNEVEALENQIKGKGEVSKEEIENKKEKLKELKEKEGKLKLEKSKFENEYNKKKIIKNLLEEYEKYKEVQKKLQLEEKNIEELKLKLVNNEDAFEINEGYTAKVEKEKKVKEDKEKLEKKVKEVKQLKEKINKLKTEIEGYKDKENEAIENSKKLEVDPKERELLNELIQLEEKIGNKNRELGKDNKELLDTVSKISSLEKEYNEKEIKFNTYKKELEELEKTPNIDTTTLLIENGKLESEIQSVKKLEKELEELEFRLKKNKKEYKELEEKLEDVKILIKVEEEKEKNDLAYQLAKKLKENDLCPVCGSNHHPKLAKPSVEIDSELKNALEEELEVLQSKFHKLDLKGLEDEINSKKKELDGRKSSNLERIYKEKEENTNILIKKEEEKVENRKSLEKLINQVEKKLIEIKGNVDNQTENRKKLESSIKELDIEIKELKGEITDKLIISKIEKISLEELKEQYEKLKLQEKEYKKVILEGQNYRGNSEKLRVEKEKLEKQSIELDRDITSLTTTLELEKDQIKDLIKKLDLMVEKSKFENVEEGLKSLITAKLVGEYKEKIKEYDEKVIGNNELLKNVKEKLGDDTITSEEWNNLEEGKNRLEEEEKLLIKDVSSLNNEIGNMENILKEVGKLLEEKKKEEKKYHLLEELSNLFKGNAFVEYLAIGKLKNITIHASKRLEKITNGRYGIEVGEDANFLIRDNFNGGVKRRAATLSGGETFLVSLSLALALSNQIQLKGKANLEFFFLDEGFGTLDTSLLDRVIASLESLKEDEKLKVGIITHVEELKERVPRKLEVLGAISGERGSKVVLN